MKTSFVVLVGAVLFLNLVRCAPSSPPSAKGHVLLAIFAHPDDESTVGPVLSKFAAEGATVYLAVATDGRLGVAAHAGIPAGDSLATTRAGEINCAAEKLGINPPIMIKMQDQLKMGQGLAALTGQLDTIRQRVTQLFTELKPDVVITWGPSGWTGHHDHRLVGSVVSEVFASKRWDKPSRLYYPELPAGSMGPNGPIPLATVDPSFLKIHVTISEDNYNKAKEAWLCHRSQYTPEMVEQLFQSLKSVQKETSSFRPFETYSSDSFWP